MKNTDDFMLVFITAPDIQEGNRIGKELVQEKLAACASVLPGLTSHYWWEGQVETSDEVLIILKTSSESLEKLGNLAKQLHPCDVPEIVAIPLVAGEPGYLEWVAESIKI